MNMLSRESQSAALLAAGAYWASPVVIQVRDASAITLAAQYTAGTGATDGQAQFYVEFVQRDSAGTAISLGVEAIRGESPASSGHMKELRALDHQTRKASGGAVAASEAIWTPAAVCCDELHVYAKEIGDVAKPGALRLSWCLQ